MVRLLRRHTLPMAINTSFLSMGVASSVHMQGEFFVFTLRYFDARCSFK